MFFSLCKEKKDNFPCHFVVDDWILNTDNGWKLLEYNDKTLIYKGYCDNFPIESVLTEITLDQKYTGNFCCFVFEKEQVTFKTDIYRSFIAYFDTNQITNLIKIDNTIHNNETFILKNPWNIVKTKLEKQGLMSLTAISEDNIIKEIDKMMSFATINEEMTRFLLVKFINRYYNQKYMWEDAIFVHLFEKYFAKLNTLC